jgi:hypothetical protein
MALYEDTISVEGVMLPQMRLELKNTIFWDFTPCGFCKKGHFGGMFRLHHQGDKKR